MTIVIRCYIILVLVLTCASRVYAQAIFGKEYTTTIYDDKTSLPQNSVRSIEIDKHGFMWLATEFGLVRFDGVHFKIFNKSNSPALTSNRIQLVFELGKELYVLDGLGGIVHINTETQRLENVPGLLNETNIIIRPVVADARPLLTNSPRLADYEKELKRANFCYQFADSSIFIKNGDDSAATSLSKENITHFRVPVSPELRDLHFLLKDALYIWAGSHFTEISNGKISRERVPLAGELWPLIAGKKKINNPACRFRLFLSKYVIS